MNIFATDSDPHISAQALDDKRIGSQLREAVQLLCMCPLYVGTKPYRPFNPQHPASAWVNADITHADWLAAHASALAEEYEYRFQKAHGSAAPFVIPATRRRPSSFYNGAKNAVRQLDFTHIPDVHEAYRCYLAARWPRDIRTPKWTRRGTPSWYTPP